MAAVPKEVKALVARALRTKMEERVAELNAQAVERLAAEQQRTYEAITEQVSRLTEIGAVDVLSELRDANPVGEYRGLGRAVSDLLYELTLLKEPTKPTEVIGLTYCQARAGEVFTANIHSHRYGPRAQPELDAARAELARYRNMYYLVIADLSMGASMDALRETLAKHGLEL